MPRWWEIASALAGGIASVIWLVIGLIVLWKLLVPKKATK